MDATQDSDDETGSQRTNPRHRRAKLILQRAQAVEIAESDATLATADTPTRSNTQGSLDMNDTVHNTDIRVALSGGIIPPTESTRLKPLNVISVFPKEPSGSPLDLVFSWIDSPWIQFFIAFVIGATSISLVADIPTIYLVTAVALLSIICFRVLENRQKAG